MEYKYDVALSFAGEDRTYVDQVATILRENGIRVFYDKFEEVDLWGKDLGIHFDYVYRQSARYCVIFISQNYKNKIWTKYEVRNIIARAIENNEEYILPAKFDNTELEGIRSTLGHIDISQTSPQELASKIIRKLGREDNIPLPEKEQPVSPDNVYLSSYIHVDDFSGIVGFTLGVTVTNIIKEERYYQRPIFKLSQKIDGKVDTFQLTDMTPHINFPKKIEYGEQLDMQFQLRHGFIEKLNQLKGTNSTLTATISTTLNEKYTSNEFSIDQIIAWYESTNNLNNK